MPFQVVGDDMAWMSKGVFVKLSEPRSRIGEGEIIHVEKKSPYKFFFYISGYMEENGKYGTEERLAECYRKCLSLAESYQCETIVFPFMGNGKCGISGERELKMISSVLAACLMTTDMYIYLSVPDRGVELLPEKRFAEICSFVDGSYVEPEKEFPQEREEDISAVGRGSRFASGMQAASTFAPVNSLNEYVNQTDGSFADYLQRLIDQKGLTNTQVYKRANLTKQYFSKIINGKISPAKEKLLCIAIALQLNLDETVEFLNSSGYAFSPYCKTDLVFKYYIIQKEFDIFSIDIALYEMGLPSVMD